MSDDLIPADVLEFLLARIDSIAELEALLLLRIEDRSWTVGQMATRLYISEADAAHVVSRLERAELCARTQDCFRYALKGSALGEIVDRLARTYAECLIPVTNLIHEKPSKVQLFADAFRFRKGR